MAEKGNPRNLKPFQPGQSGNPGDRPKGTHALATLILEVTQDGEELVRFFMAVFAGRNVLGRTARLSDRIKAAEWLTDRGWGKAPQTMDAGPPITVIVTNGGGV